MSQQFNFVETPLYGLIRVDRKPIYDQRGFFSRFFCAEAFKEIGFSKPIAQMNHTLSKQMGTIRGMHFQSTPYIETKIVSCIQGEIFDVAIDIRKSSRTFLQWYGEVLSSENQSSLYIPEGFAHGFQTLTDDCQLIYLHSDYYTPKAESAINALDPMIGIDWPLNITEISDRDRHHPFLNAQFEGV